MITPGIHITVDGREYELTCRAKCGPFRGWMARPCMDGKPVRDRERWLSDEEITGVLRNGQYVMEIAYADTE